MKLDEIDYKILSILQSNGRITNVQLSQEVGLSPAPTLERVKKLESNGYIQSYHASVNAEKLGLGLTIFIQVSLNLHKDTNLDTFMENIQNFPEVIECYQVTGEGDFLLKVQVENMNAYQQFILHKITKVHEIGKLQSMVVLGTVKKSRVLPLPRFTD